MRSPIFCEYVFWFSSDFYRRLPVIAAVYRAVLTVSRVFSGTSLMSYCEKLRCETLSVLDEVLSYETWLFTVFDHLAFLELSVSCVEVSCLYTGHP